jgi:hypothetical protein
MVKKLYLGDIHQLNKGGQGGSRGGYPPSCMYKIRSLCTVLIQEGTYWLTEWLTRLTGILFEILCNEIWDTE